MPLKPGKINVPEPEESGREWQIREKRKRVNEIDRVRDRLEDGLNGSGKEIWLKINHAADRVVDNCLPNITQVIEMDDAGQAYYIFEREEAAGLLQKVSDFAQEAREQLPPTKLAETENLIKYKISRKQRELIKEEKILETAKNDDRRIEFTLASDLVPFAKAFFSKYNFKKVSIKTTEQENTVTISFLLDQSLIDNLVKSSLPKELLKKELKSIKKETIGQISDIVPLVMPRRAVHRFKNIRIIGMGSMGTIFLAELAAPKKIFYEIPVSQIKKALEEEDISKIKILGQYETLQGETVRVKELTETGEGEIVLKLKKQIAPGKWEDLPKSFSLAALDQVISGDTQLLISKRELEEGQKVVIKTVLFEIANEKKSAELAREAINQMKVNSKNVVKVHYLRPHYIHDDIGKEYLEYEIVMEYVEGEDLYEKIEKYYDIRNPLPKEKLIENFLHIAPQIARGISVIHQAGIVHQDIKPANVILSKDGEAKITDFGLTAIKKEEGVFFGTPYYISPEMIEGEILGESSDIYSLGATFFHLLKGEQLFINVNPLSVFSHHLSYTAPSAETSKVEINELIKAMLQKRPRDRKIAGYGRLDGKTVAEFLDDYGFKEVFLPGYKAKFGKPSKKEKAYLRKWYADHHPDMLVKDKEVYMKEAEEAWLANN